MSKERGERQVALKRIFFAGKNHLGGTLDGTKLNTLRSYRPEGHDLKDGEFFVAVFTVDELELVLQATSDTDIKPFRELTEEDLRKNDYTGTIEEALEDMRDYYPDLTLDTPMAVINFKIPEINGVPVIRNID